jgi:hypothetical protein
VPGNRIAVQDGFILVNGVRVPGGLLLTQNSLGRPLSPFSRAELEVPADSVFLLSTHSPRSWDSRYYGHARRLEILLDEFASLGRVPVIEDTLAYLRGYGVRCTLAVQDLNQIVRNFSKTETLTGTCGVLVATATQQAETRALLSNLAGEATVRYEKVSKGRGGGLAGRKNTTRWWEL